MNTKKISKKLEDHKELAFPSVEGLETFAELTMLDADLYGELMSLSKQAKDKCTYLKKYKQDYEEIKREAQEKSLEEVIVYLTSIKELIDLCEECERSDKPKMLMPCE